MSANSTVNRSRMCLTNGKDVFASYREREERVRQAREKHDEERMKKIDDFKQASLANQRYRGQIKEQRKRRLDDVRTHNNERQNVVLERSRQILEAEKDRREALLRMKLERVAKLEAEKNAQRNAMRFAFGSVSTPRLDESYGMSDSQSIFNLVLPTLRRSASLNRNFNAEDLMTKSRTSLLSSSFFCHGRRKTDLTPTLPEDKIHHADKTHILDVSTAKQAPQKGKMKPKSAVAKEEEAELEQIRLAEEHRQLKAIEDKEKKDEEERQDRRKALLRRKLEIEAKLEAKKNAQRNAMLSAFGSGSTPQLYGMSNSQSMFNLVLPANVNTTPTSRRSASLNRNFNAEDLMTKSCTSLPSSSFFGRRKTDLTPTLPKDSSCRNATDSTVKFATDLERLKKEEVLL